MERERIALADYLEDNLDTEIDNELDGSDLNLQSIENFANLNESDEYKMVGEEENVQPSYPPVSKSIETKTSNIPANESYETKLSEQTLTPKNIETFQQSAEKNDTTLPDGNLDEIIGDLSDKIKNLEKILESSSNQNDNTFVENNNVNEKDINSYKNIENSNLFNNVNNTTNTTEEDNTNIKNIKNVISEINELKNLKQIYEQRKNETNIAKREIEKNIFNESGKITFDNFTPNFRIDPSDSNFDSESPKPWKKLEATEIAIETEKKMGGDPIVEVVPGIGDVVIDKSSQVNVEDAVKQHGGWEKAISDSISNQENYSNYNENKNSSFVENFSTLGDQNTFNKFDNFNTSEFSGTEEVDNNNFYEKDDISNINNFNNSDNIFDNTPDPNANLVKNTGESIVVLNKISKQLENISNGLMKSFNTLGKSIKDIKSTQKNIYYQNGNSSSNPVSTPAQNNLEPSNLPNIRGDSPLKEDFPENFNMSELFSNLRP